MLGRNRNERPKRDRTNNSLAQYGLFDVSMDNENEGNLDGDDSDLEAELLALSSGNGAKPRKPQRKAPAAPSVNLDAMVAASMKDIPSDAELSGDEDDPDLLSELNDIAGDERTPSQTSSPSPVKENSTSVLTTLQERLKMYQTAEKNAKEAGETSRARRFGRGIKTLQDMIKQSNAGRAINNDDIPPEVTVNIQKRDEDTKPNEPAAPASEATPEPPTDLSVKPEDEELLNLLNTRRNEYKAAALQAKQSGDSTTAIGFIKIAKQFEAVIKAVESGQPVDLSRMPGPPQMTQPASPPIEESVKQTASDEEPSQSLPEAEPTLIAASSVAEALQQRLEVYKNQESKAKEEGNSSKARRMGRIVKQYEDAIKKNNAGKPIAVEDLPTPPGYAPIPVENSAKPEPAVAKPTPVSPKASDDPRPHSSKLHPSKSNSANARIEKQVAMLVRKQKEFKDAALNAKRKGELAQAKEFLRTAKGFDPLIAAAQGGLPVDISSLPVPPTAKSELQEEYDIILADEAAEVDPEHMDILSRLEQQLQKQLKYALTTRDHNKAIGDVAGMNRFEQLAVTVTRDLDIIRLAKKNNSGVPKFHYETKDFSVVKSFTDLSDNDLELTIVRGINISCNNPKDVDTYVKFEFPYPQEEPVKNKTGVVRDTNNPEYNETFVLPIQRSARNCLRVFKRHGIKFEVYSKGGFFRGDTLLGTTTAKLQPLETQCELHESFDLLEGRRKVGGKLEIKLRVRDPLLTRQVEQLSEKWLILGN